MHLLTVLFAAGCASSGPIWPPVDKAAAAHAAWVEKYLTPLEPDVICRITTLFFSRGPEDESPMESVTVHSDGRFQSESSIASGTLGGGGGVPLSVEDTRAFLLLAPVLPSDGNVVPASDSLIAIQILLNGKVTTNVYDLADLPEPVRQYFRSTKFSCPLAVPRFQPGKNVIASEDNHSGGAFAVYAGGSRIAYFGGGRDLSIWDAATFQRVQTIPNDTPFPRRFVFSPDERTVVVAGETRRAHFFKVEPNDRWTAVQCAADLGNHENPIETSLPCFLDGGRFLLSGDGVHKVDAFETSGWKKAALPNGVPKNCVGYSPCGNESAVAETAMGHICIWDPRTLEEVAVIKDKGFHLRSATFSPSRKSVAIVICPVDGAEEEDQLQVIDVGSGRLLRELLIRSAYRTQVGIPIWTSDGCFVLAPCVGTADLSEIHFWDLATGRDRAIFKGTEGDIFGIGLIGDGQTLVAGSDDGHLRTWDLSPAVRRCATVPR